MNKIIEAKELGKPYNLGVIDQQFVLLAAQSSKVFYVCKGRWMITKEEVTRTGIFMNLHNVFVSSHPGFILDRMKLLVAELESDEYYMRQDEEYYDHIHS